MVREMFDASDTNKNGVLEPEEFKQFTLFVLEAIQGLTCLMHSSEEHDEIGAMFASFDKNKDGVLDWAEVWSSVEALHCKIEKN